MRAITRDAANALIARRNFSRSNTQVEGGDMMFLHGNRIAWIEGDRYCLTLAGWGTATTRERLDGLLESIGSPWRFAQHDHDQILVKPTTGKRIHVDTRDIAHFTLDGELIEVTSRKAWS